MIAVARTVTQREFFIMKSSTQNVRDRILDTAGLLFAEHGFDNVSTRQIADVADVRHGSLYYHFTNKEMLYANVFRLVYDLDNALTYDVLLQTEPLVFDTPEGKAYAIQRIVFDYFQRHVFMPEQWKRKLVFREMLTPSTIFRPYVEKKLQEETDKMLEFFRLLCPEGSDADAYYWTQFPCAQALYYFETFEFAERRNGPEFIEELNKTIIKRTAKLMIAFLGLPIPAMLE